MLQETYTESLVLLVIVVYSDDCCSVSRSWFWMSVVLLSDISCAVNWSLLFMRSCYLHACGTTTFGGNMSWRFFHEFLWFFPIPAWFWTNTRGSIQMRRTRTTTTSRYQLATGMVLGRSFLVVQVSWCPVLRRMTLLSLRSCGRIFLVEQCVVALEGWIK